MTSASRTMTGHPSAVPADVVGVIAGSRWMPRKAEEPPIPGYRRRRQRREAPPGPARTRQAFVGTALGADGAPTGSNPCAVVVAPREIDRETSSSRSPPSTSLHPDGQTAHQAHKGNR